jgi:hypothetical protein
MIDQPQPKEDHGAASSNAQVTYSASATFVALNRITYSSHGDMNLVFSIACIDSLGRLWNRSWRETLL